MKNHLLKRILSMILVVALLAGYYVPGAQAASTGLSWKESDQEVRVDLTERKVESHVKERYAPTDMVRASIVLEEKPTIQAGFGTRNLAANSAAMAYSRNLREKQETMAQTISNQVLGGAKLDVVWNLTLVGNIISVNVPYGKLEAIAKVDGVAGVVLENVYEPCVVDRSPVAEPQMYVSLRMTGSSLAWSTGYTGAGSRIAVIDTGTDTDHQSLDADAFLYSLQQNAEAAGISYNSYLAGLNLLDEQEIASVLRDLNIYERDSSLTSGELYLNEKLPFAVNYVDGSSRRLVVDHESDRQGEHGSHVAGIATANRYIPSGNGYEDALKSVMVAGTAPDAQLITMKVFGYNGGPSDADYLAAVEDAILLGCDSVNLSLGTSTSGFGTDPYFADILEYMTTTDTVVVASAGNSYDWAMATPNSFLYSQDVSLDTVGSPGSYYSFLTVASVENDGGWGPAFKVGDRVVGYYENYYSNSPMTWMDTSYDLSGTAYDYVFIDGLGNQEDYAGIDLTDKIVFCSRGNTSFSEKANTAVELGAAATVIYNNEPGALYMELYDYYYSNPCVAIAQVEADAIRSMSQKKQTSGGLTYYTGTMTVLGEHTGVMNNSAYLNMSDYSSWGVPGDLSLKPEITAPGGYIYSIYGETPYGGGTDQYEIMSGTSMAAPAVTGMAALMAQYLRESGLADREGISVRDLAQSLLMSTATPELEEASGNYYSILKQGAGLARVDLATAADSYILVSGQPDGKVKAELGDDPNRTGVYEFSFTINNLTDRTLAYKLSAELFRQATFDLGNITVGEPTGQLLMDKFTTSLPGVATFTANGVGVNTQNNLSGYDLNGDGRTNASDADYLLEYLLGNESTLHGSGDVNGDGSVNTYDAHVLLTKLSSNAGVSVPAGGSVTIGVTLTLTESGKAMLDELYENGSYVEAYVFAESVATQEGVAGTKHSIPVLAFYGDWTDPNMFDHGSYVELMNGGYTGLTPYMYYEVTSGNVLLINYDGYNDYAFGGNPLDWEDAYHPERNAFNSRDDSCLAYQYFTLIRNAADSQLVVSNADTGEVYLQYTMGGWYSAYYYVNGGYWDFVQDYAYLGWYGDDAYGNPLPEGTNVEVSMIAVPETRRNPDGSFNYDNLGEGAYLTTSFTIDNTAPELIDMTQNDTVLTVRAKDNRYLAGAVLTNSNGSTWYDYTLADQANPGTEVTMELDLSGVMSSSCKLVVYDYAMNQCTYDITLDVPDAPDVPDVEGPYFTVSDYQGEAYYGIYMNGDSEYLTSTSRGMVEAAEYVDGYVYEIVDDGYLYYGREDLSGFSYMGQLDSSYYYEVTNFLDMAYNYDDGKLYALFYASRNNQSYPYLCTIDMNTGAWNVLYELPVDVDTLAVDGEGNFYSMAYDAPYLYTYTLDDLYEGNMYYVGHTGYYYTGDRSSMTWDHSTDTLYWAFPEILLKVDHNTGDISVVTYCDYRMTGLMIRSGSGNGTNSLNIKPSGITDPAQWPAINANIDEDALMQAKAHQAAAETTDVPDTTEPTEIPAPSAEATGGLNSVVNVIPRNTAAPQSTGEFEDDTNRIILTLTSGKDQEGSTNGRMTVSYDSQSLKLVSVSGKTEAFAYTAEDGTVEVAYATTYPISCDTEVAVLTFETLVAGQHEITVLHTEDGEGPFNKEEQLDFVTGCIHSYRAEVTAPTCTEQGYTTYTCRDCGHSYEGDYVAALGHDYDAVITPPTCDDKGYTTYTCARCGDSYVGDYTAALGHTYNAVVTEPTCTEPGYTTHTCIRCGVSYVDNEVPATGHEYVDGACIRCGEGFVALQLVNAPTVTNYAIGDALILDGILVASYQDNGDVTYLTAENLTVLSCDMSTVGTATAYVGIGDLSVSFPVYVHARRIDQVLDPSTYPESNHDYGNDENDWQTVSYPGATSLTLQFSNETYLEQGYDFIYVYDGNDNLIATYTGWEAEGVTLTVPGDTAKINLTSDYSYCYYGYSFTSITANTVEHTGESVGYKAPTCTAPGYTDAFQCEICDGYFGAQLIPALGHDYESVVTDPTCDQDGYTTYTCNRCGDVRKEDFEEAYGHNYDNGVTYVHPTATADGTMSTTCGNCGEVVTVILANDVSAPAGSPFSDEEWEVLQITNSLRVSAGREPLTGFELLQRAAGIRAEEIDEYFDHTRPDGRSCYTAFDDVGLFYYGAGENIAAGYHSPAYVMYGWMNSPGHRENILVDWFEHLGVGYDYITIDDWVQMFLSGSGYTSYELVLPEDTTYEPGTLIDEMGVYMLLYSNYYGKCYLPIQSMYCEGYDPNRAGTQTVTVSVLGFSDSFEVTIAGDDPCADGHTPVVRGAYDATCTENGYTGDTYCSVCGELIEAGQVIPATGHNYGAWYETVAPGCENDGQERHDCSACGHYETRVVDALGHDYDAVVTDPTCTEQGYTTYTCSRCGHSYVSDYTDVLDHDYDEVITAPTCEEDGYTTYTCTRCGYSYVDNYVGALGHDYDAAVTPPTCTEKGYTTYTCARCDHSYVGDYTGALGHDYNAVVTDPTCEDGGYTTYTCTRCDHSYVGDYTDALGHNYKEVVTDPTCENGGYTTYTCTRCDHSYVDDYTEALGHDYNEVVTDPTCTEQGYTTYTCSVCGDSYVGDYTEPVDHSYEDGHCTRCGEDEYLVKWYSGTTSLNGTIDLNIYVLLSENLVNADDTYVRFTYAGKTVEVPMAEALHSPNEGNPNRYRFSCPIYAKELADSVNVKFMKGEKMLGTELNYSVKQYCENQIRRDEDAELVALCKALLNYGAAAQQLLNYNTENLANASLSDADKVLQDVNASAYEYSVIGSEDGIKARSATLMLEDVVKVRVYFTLTGNKSIEEYTITIDGKEVTPSYNEKGWYVETDGIPGKDLEKMFTVQVGGITVKYGALSYVNSKAGGSNVQESNISKALYAYWQAAEELLG